VSDWLAPLREVAMRSPPLVEPEAVREVVAEEMRPVVAVPRERNGKMMVKVLRAVEALAKTPDGASLAAIARRVGRDIGRVSGQVRSYFEQRYLARTGVVMRYRYTVTDKGRARLAKIKAAQVTPKR
jgi:hypothetical protein